MSPVWIQTSSRRFIVLDNGAVVGQGKHDALLKECEAYARIAASQEMGGVE